MRKLTSAAICALACGALSVQAFAADTARVYVTLSNGTLEMAQEAATVHDNDGDGALTINDALLEVSEEGSYASAETEYGLSMTKLLGVENGGAYGYYVNNAAAMSLLDPIKDEDYISAFVYTDTAGYSDTYCFFDKNELVLNDFGAVELTLKCASYDENWSPVELPVANAHITLNGRVTEYVTDSDGHVSIDFAREGQNAGEFTVSAVSDEQILVPPVCRLIVNVQGESGQYADYEETKGSPDTGASNIAVFAGLAVLAAGAFAAAKNRK